VILVEANRPSISILWIVSVIRKFTCKVESGSRWKNWGWAIFFINIGSVGDSLSFSVFAGVQTDTKDVGNCIRGIWIYE
jgi:hypothetical protein